MRQKIFYSIIVLLIIGFIFPVTVNSQACVCEGHSGESGCCVGNQGQSCGNCGTIDCAGSCSGQGVCSPGQTQCSNSLYQTCSSSCGWTNSGTDDDQDSVDYQCGDSLCDNSPGVFNSTKTQTETSCTDSLDNDCDTLLDCEDSDCAGSISGNVKNSENQNMQDARIDAYQGSVKKHTSFTDTQGSYDIGNALCGNYNLLASAEGYVSNTKSADLPPNSNIIVNFDGEDTLISAFICEDDCTHTGDDLIHEECSNINGCQFYDSIAAELCDLSQTGWQRAYNSTYIVECGEGIPYESLELKATVSCPKENLIKKTRTVNYQGRLVRLYVAVCG